MDKLRGFLIMNKNETQTEQKIFDAAAEIFFEKGLQGSRMQEIADRAGINKALLHYYYRSKDKLFTAVFMDAAKKLFKKYILYFSDPTLNLEEKIHLFYREHISFLMKNPKLPSFIIGEINRNPKLINELVSNEDFSQALTVIKEQYRAEVKNGIYNDYEPFHLFINIAAMSVFPFAARGIVTFLMQREGIDFNKEMEKRKNILPRFVLNALNKQE